MDGVRFDYNNQDELESRIALGEGAFNICTRTNFYTYAFTFNDISSTRSRRKSKRFALLGGGGVKDVDLRKLHCAYALN